MNQGRIVLRIEADDVALPQTLIALGYLDPAREDDRAAIAEAAATALRRLTVGTGKRDA